MTIVPLSSLPPISEIEAIGSSGKTVKPVGSEVPFAGVLQDAMDTLQQTQAQAAQDAYDLAMGNVSDLHSLMINSTMEATAVETVVQLTSRAVSAYKEIMQMQI